MRNGFVEASPFTENVLGEPFRALRDGEGTFPSKLSHSLASLTLAIPWHKVAILVENLRNWTKSHCEINGNHDAKIQKRFDRSAQVSERRGGGRGRARGHPGCCERAATRSFARGHGAAHAERTRSRNARRAGCADREPLRVRLHGGRDQVAGDRVRGRQSGIEFPRAARIGHQLRRKRESGVHHLLSRRIGRRHGSRLLQDRRQADGEFFSTAPWVCSTPRWPFTTRFATACRFT